MERRKFLKLSVYVSSLALMPQYIYAENLSNISFSTDVFDSGHQTIIIFLAGGASQLAGNLSNLEEINQNSQNNYYNYFGKTYLSKTEKYDLWKEAGGESMEDLIDSSDLSIIRTCYSPLREKNYIKAHGICTLQNQKGNYDLKSAGILTKLSKVMEDNNKLKTNDLPFATLDGENALYSGNDSLAALKAVSMTENLGNPYDRGLTSSIYYSREERDANQDPIAYRAKDPIINNTFDTLAKTRNTTDSMNDFLDARQIVSQKIKSLKGSINEDELSGFGYTLSSKFHKKLSVAVEFLNSNPTTKTMTLSTSGLGGWDDHSYSQVSYTRRMQDLFKALKASMAHLENKGIKNKVSIIVYGEFGRNVNLNNSFGWDHGNLQNVYILGGTDYFYHAGNENALIGETIVDNGGKAKSGRIWLKPKEGTPSFDPLQVAATIYKIAGITNPKELTGGYDAINTKIDGRDFFSL